MCVGPAQCKQATGVTQCSRHTQHCAGGHRLESWLELVGRRGLLAGCVSTGQRRSDWAGADRRHNNNIFATKLISMRCEQAVDGRGSVTRVGPQMQAQSPDPCVGAIERI